MTGKTEIGEEKQKGRQSEPGAFPMKTQGIWFLKT